MDQLPFYIITSDATSGILPAAGYLYNKYWQPDGGQKFKVLGNHPPAQKLADNFEFVKIKDENNIQKWTRYIYDYIAKNNTAEYFVLALDDYLPNQKLRPEILSGLLSYAKNHGKVGRIELGQWEEWRYEPVEKLENYEIVKLKNNARYRTLQIKPSANYRISPQISVWNREYFLKYFNHDWTPWQLELTGSELARNDGWEVIAAINGSPFDWVAESALSGRWPGMVNILGMPGQDVKELIDLKFFDPATLQYGIWYECRIPFLSRFQSISKKLTRIPKFLEIGYEFDWDMIRLSVRSRTLQRLQKHYKNVYEE